MTSDRSQAYGRVVHTLRDMGPSKLLDAEQQRIRDAADALFFCEEIVYDAGARVAISDVTALARTLVESERWSEERARQLLDDVMACGPVAPVAS